ncbi:MAG: hypothetical protein AB1801_23580, partial [Chloroflexota bacterium]
RHGDDMRQLLLVLFVAGLLATHGPATAQANEPDQLTMTAQPAFGGRFKNGEWLPIFVDIENAGPELSGEVRVSLTNQTGQLNFVVPAELPPGARKRFTLYILPNNFSRSARVELVQNDDSLLSREVSLTLRPNDRYIIGLAAAEAKGFTALNPPQLPGRREQAETVFLPLAEIPDRPEGLRLLNALALNDVDSGRLTPAQQTTLKNWVAGGGRLILGGGAGAERTLAGLPPELQPVTLTGLQEVTVLPGLEAYTQEPIRVPGPFLLAGAEAAAGATVLLRQAPASAASPPLVVELAHGDGYVDFIALDLSQSPFDAWAGVSGLAERLLSPGAAWPSQFPPDVSPQQMTDSQMSYTLTNLPSLDLPSIRFLGILLAGYIMLVGPVNYFLLRWRDRLAWAWLTIPAITLAFSGLAYGLGLSLRGNEIIVNQLSIIELGPDGQASRGRTYVGIFSPNRQAYDVAVHEKALIRPLGEGGYDPWSGSVNTPGVMSVVQSEPARVRGLSVNQWSMQSFVADTLPDEPPGLTARLTADRQGVRGSLVNQSSRTWQDVFIIFNNQFQKLGDLAPGQTAQVEIDLSQNPDQFMWFNSYLLYQDELNGPTGPNREISFKQGVLDNTVFNANYGRSFRGPLLIAWLKDSLLQVQLEDEAVTRQETALVYGSLPLEFGDRHIEIPPGFSQAETLSQTGGSGECFQGSGAIGYSIFQGSVETKLSLPPDLSDMRPTHMDLYIRTDGGWQWLPAVELYDQPNQEWVPLAGAVIGANRIEELDRFYDSGSASIQVRISSDGNGGGGCLFLDLAVEGERL